MDEETLIKTEELLGMFSERDEKYDDMTQALANALERPLFEALHGVFNCVDQQVEWESIDLIGAMIIMVCNVQYDKLSDIPTFVNRITPPEDDGEESLSTRRRIRMGIPITMAYADPITMQAFLDELIASVLEDDEDGGDETNEPVQFDPSALTTDQVMQMLLFQGHTKGVVH
jgi:hypothetical protein